MVKLDDGQKQEMSLLEEHCGISGSQVFKQDGSTFGQGAFEDAGGGDTAARDDTGPTDEAIEESEGTTVVLSGLRGVEELEAAGESVEGGGALQFVQMVEVDVTTAVEIVNVLWIIVLLPEVEVRTTGQVVTVE